MRGLSTRNIVPYDSDAIFRVKPSGTLFARPFCPRGTPAVAKLMPVRPNTVRRFGTPSSASIAGQDASEPNQVRRRVVLVIYLFLGRIFPNPGYSQAISPDSPESVRAVVRRDRDF